MSKVSKWVPTLQAPMVKTIIKLDTLEKRLQALTVQVKRILKV